MGLWGFGGATSTRRLAFCRDCPATLAGSHQLPVELMGQRDGAGGARRLQARPAQALGRLGLDDETDFSLSGGSGIGVLRGGLDPLGIAACLPPLLQEPS